MASAQNSIQSTNFQIPSEPHPISYLPVDDEDESFVVLCKSLSDDMHSHSESPEPVVDKEVIAGMKNLISNELKEIDEAEKADNKQILVNSTDLTDGLQSIASDNTSDLIQAKLEEIIQENNRLKETIIQNNMSMKNQYERIQAWQNDVQEVHKAHKDKLLEAKEIIDKLKSDNKVLTTASAMLKKEIDNKHMEIVALQEQNKNGKQNELVEDLKKENDEMKKEIVQLRDELKKHNEIQQQEITKNATDNFKQFELDLANSRIKDLELLKEKLMKDKDQLIKENDEMKMNIHSSTESELTINMLKQEINLVKQQNELFQNQLTQANQQIYILSHKNLQSKTEIEELENLRQQLMNAQERITELQQEKATFLENAMEKDKELAIEKDKVFALEAQLDVYRGDFEAERTAKESIKSEKDQLSEDMQHLQRRNQQLQEEIEVLREKNFEYCPSNLTQNTGTTSRERSSNNSNTYKCPMCGFAFTQYQALENHVQRCVDLMEALP